MTKNVLFNVITQKTSKEGNIPRGIALSQLNHKEGTPYFFFALPKPAGAIGDYTLDTHHLSVFEESNGRMDGKSQYHYTAYLKDKNGNSFRLHIYFNPQDGYIGLPLLSRISDDGRFIPVADCEEHHEAFKALAEMSIDGLIVQIRKDQKELIAKLKTEYELLEKEGTELSKELERNKDPYKANVDRQIEKLEELKNYSNTDPILDNLSYLKKLKQTPELRTPSSTSRRLEGKEHKQAAVAENPSIEVPKEVTRRASSEVKEKIRIDKEIAELKVQFEQLKLLKDDKLVAAIAALNARLVQLELEMDDGSSLKQLHDVRTLRISLDDKASKMVQYLLAVGKYTETAPLAPFYRLVSDSMIRLAIAQNNFRLLDFLFKNKLIPLPYTNFTIKDKQYTSIVDYYFKQATTKVDAEKFASIEECLDVLIKNGLSLMEIDSSNGLPFAMTVLSATNHPFKETLNRNKEITINNPMFYKQLNHVLRVIAAQPTCTKKEQVNLFIENSKLQLICIQCLGFSLAQYECDFDAYIDKALGSKWSQALESQPDIWNVKFALGERLRVLLSKLPPDARFGVVNDIKQAYKELKKTIDAVKDSDRTVTFKEFNQHILLQYKHGLKVLELTSELNDHNLALEALGSKSSGKNKRAHKKEFMEQIALFNKIQQKIDILKKTPWPSFDSTRCPKKESSTPTKMKEHSKDEKEVKDGGDKKTDDEKLLDLGSNFFGSSVPAKADVAVATAENALS